jgi:hypothetical protein
LGAKCYCAKWYAWAAVGIFCFLFLMRGEPEDFWV